MSKQRRKRLTFLPYEFSANALRLRIDVDGPVSDVDTTNLAATLDELAVWDELRISTRVEVQEEKIQKTIDAEDAAVWVTVRCRQTRLRDSTRLERDGTEWRGQLQLARDQLRGDVVLRAVVIATSPLPGVMRGQRIASGRDWTVRVDPTTSKSSAHLQVLFCSFRETASIPAPAEALYWLDADNEEPMLWLNEDHRAAASVMTATGTRGASARIREVAFDAISASVWSQLFVHALQDYDVHGEPAYSWHQTVLEVLGKQLYPDTPAAEVVTRVVQEFEFSGLTVLLGQLDVCLQIRNQLAGHLEKLVTEAS